MRISFSLSFRYRQKNTLLLISYEHAHMITPMCVPTRQVIDFLKGPEELEMLSFPAGAILRLRRVRHSALYTCRVAYGNKHTDIQVPRLLQLWEERKDSQASS